MPGRPHSIIHRSKFKLTQQNQQECAADQVLPVRPTGAMALQSGLAMQAGQSYPQQLVRLVGHRHCGGTAWVRPDAKT